MVAHAYTVAFEGIRARPVEVQCALTPGLPGFTIVGLPDKAVSEAKERVRAALSALSIALPAQRVTINLSPADLPKIGSHFDLPIALALLAAIDILPKDAVAETISLGELSLDGALLPVIGALPAAMAAADEDRALICPRACGPEAAWVEATRVLAPATLTAVIQHFTGQSPFPRRSRHSRQCNGRQRPTRCARPGPRKTCVGNCRRWPSPPFDGGTARIRKINDRRAPAVNPASALRA